MKMKLCLHGSPVMTFVTYAPTTRRALTNNPDPRLASSPLSPEEVEIDGLQENYVYTFSIFYENSAGRGVNGDSDQGLF